MVRIFNDKNKTIFQYLLSTINWENEMSVRKVNVRGYDYFQSEAYNSLQ